MKSLVAIGLLLATPAVAQYSSDYDSSDYRQRIEKQMHDLQEAQDRQREQMRFNQIEVEEQQRAIERQIYQQHLDRLLFPNLPPR